MIDMTRFRYVLTIICLALSVQFTPTFVHGSEERIPATKQNDRILGERIYRDGILPSGKSMLGYIKGDLQAHGTSFACVSCHMQSGLGSLEGNVLTTPTNGASLYRPRAPFTGLRSGGMSMGRKKLDPPPPPPQARPAYTDESLAAALRGGVDPSGRVFNQVMPRYNFQDSDMAILVSYLKNLSSQFSPGVDATTLHFATVITDDLPPESYEPHLALLDDFILKTNERTDYIENQVKNTRIKRQLMISGRVAYRKLALSRWLLKGAPETWRSQLEEYYRKEPVFALLGGMSGTVWKPVHDFCEANRLPSLFPQTDFPVISDTDWYTLYISKGYYLEGETAARFLNRSDTFPEHSKVLLIARDSNEGKMLTDGFKVTWRELGRPAPIIVSLAGKEALNAERLAALVEREKPNAAVIWDNASLLTALNAMSVAKVKLPQKIIISSTYIGKASAKLDEQLREITYLTYPVRLPAEEKQLEAFYFGTNPGNLKQGSDIALSVKRTYPLTRLLSQLLPEMKEQFYGDYLLDLIAMIKDLEVPLYERMSFGPGQRYASKGCYVVQLGKGDRPELIKRSDWVIH